MANAKFTIDSTPSADRGFDALHGATLSLQLEDQPSLDVYKCEYYVNRYTKGAPALAFSGSGLASPPNGIVSVGMPVSGVHAWEIVCRVNNGVDNNGVARPDWYFSRIVAIRSSSVGTRKVIAGETTEYDPQYGWVESYNEWVTGAAVAFSDLHLTGNLTVDEYAAIAGSLTADSVTANSYDCDQSTISLKCGPGVTYLTGTDAGDVAIPGEMDAAIVTGGIVRSDNWNYLTPVSETRVVSSPAEYSSTNWQRNSGSVYQSLVNTAQTIEWQIDPPEGVTITSISAIVIGNGGHGGLPGTMPKIQLGNVDDGGNVSFGAGASDTSGSVGAYQSIHSITQSGLSEVVDKTTKRYVVRVTNEAGANALSGLQVYLIKITWTRSTLTQ